MRDHNEDSLVAGAWTLCAVVTATPQTIYLPVTEPVLVAVADGLGGQPAGEQASSLAARWLARAAPALTDEAALRAALDGCNAAVYAEAALDRQRTAMGTTIAGIVATEEAVVVFNIGDSRVYVLDDTGLAQISVDDNEPAQPGRARSSVLTQTLGGDMAFAPVEPHLSTRPLDGAGRYLICTDGLTDAIDDASIAAILRAHEGGRAAFELWKATIDAGAPDNVTLALVEIGTDDSV